jgi:multiple sugar transport system ATP-binding protein
MAHVKLEDVWKKFGTTEVIKGIDLEIGSGEFVVLVGPSGCGKSTLLNLVAGLETLTSGNVYIGDRLVNDIPPKDRDIAMVFQSYALYPTKTVRKNILFGMETRRIERTEQDRALKQVTELLHIERFLDRKPGELSGGQRQRVAMGRALVRDPDVFLFDEPLSNLDAKLRIEMRTEIKKLYQRLGKTTIYVTHDQIEAMTLSDRIVVMNEGVISQIGNPVEIYRYPNSRFVANFIGRANFVEGKAVSQIGSDLTLTALGQTVTLANVQRPFTAGEDVTLIVRPEMVQVRKTGGLYNAIVRRAVYLGDVIEYDVEIAGQLITGLESDPYHTELFSMGEQVTVQFAEGIIQVLPAEKIYA